MTESQVIRSDGVKQPFNSSRLKKSLLKLLKELDSNHINLDKIILKITLSLPEEIHKDELVELVSETLATMTTIHPDHSILASRFKVVHLQKHIPKTYSELIKQFYNYENERTKLHSPLVSKKVHDIVSSNSEIINRSIKPERDLNLTYFGLKTLEKSYLLKLNGQIAETPQFMFMRVSLGIHGDDLDSVIETYDLMSQRYFIHGSPTLFNSGTPKQYLSSCFLLGTKDDSIDGIYKTLYQCAMISKAAGGIGLHVSNIRSSGSYIAGSNGTSNGIVPMLRVFNNTARYVDQGGNKRPGAFAIYLEPWHSDVFEFLDMKKNHGLEETKARDLFFALWIPDLFMEKVKTNQDWYLFSPNEAKGLNEHYGEEFDNLYSKYVKEGLYTKKIKAQKLWNAILEAQTETGGPFMLYKDACNSKSNQKNLGVIKSSNLCCEVVQYSSPDEIAVCNLASVALPTFIQKHDDKIWYDFVKLHSVVKVLTKNLNRVIDVGDYPLEEAKISNLRNRPIAIGVQGLADVFMELRMPFDSKDAKLLNSQIFETIYHASVEASMELSEKEGPYETFTDSPASKGLLQFDLWNFKPKMYKDWDELKLKIMKFGLRNSLLVAPMPTASTSQILGFTECFEPLTSNVYTRRVLSGEFQLVNKYLVQDLISLGIWDQDMKDLIVDNDGSIQNIDVIPQVIKDLYKTVWELSQKVIIDLAADRGPFIDQSQSMNIHIKDPTMGKLTSMHFYGWQKGLKTGMYYLRTQAASSAIKFTIDRSKLPMKRKQVDLERFNKRVLHYKSVENGTNEVRINNVRLEVLNDEAKEHDDVYDIHSSKPLSCNIKNPEDCESCSG